MTTESTFLPEGVSMGEFIANASYEELMTAYNAAIVGAETPDSPEVLALLGGAVNRIAPTITANLEDAGALMYDERWVTERLLSEHYYYGAAAEGGTTPLEELMQMARYADDDGVTERMLEGFDASISAAHEIRPEIEIAPIESVNLPGTMLSRGFSSAWTSFNNGGNSVIAGAYNLFVSEENEITGEELGAAYDTWSRSADAALYEAGAFTVETVQLSFSSDPEDVAESNRRTRDLGITIGDGVVDAVTGLVGLAAGGGAYVINRTPEAFGYEPTFGEDYTAWNAFDAVNGVDDAALGYIYDQFDYELRTDGPYGTFHTISEFIGTGGAGGVVIKGGVRLARGARTLDVALDATRAGDAALDAVRAGDEIATVTRIGPTRLAAEALDVADELPAAAFRPSPGMLDDVVIRGVDDAAPVIERATTIPRVPRTTEGPWGPVPRAAVAGADDTVEASARATSHMPAPAAADEVAGIVDGATDVATRPGNAATRTIAAVASRNSPRGIYRSADSVADRLTRLARAEDTVGAQGYMRRLVNDVGAGRATIDEAQITSLRTSGTLRDIRIGTGDNAVPLIDALQGAKDASRSMFGRTGHSLSHLGDTLRANTSFVGGLSLVKDVTLAPLTAARWAISNPFRGAGALKLGAVWGGVAADGYLNDHGIQDALGDAYGAAYRKIGDAFNFVGLGFAGDLSEYAAAAVDPDQTVAGELTEDGRILAATAVSTVAPFVAMVVPGEQDGTHTRIVEDETPAPAAADSETGLPVAPAAPDGTGTMSPEDEAQMQRFMESFARSPVGQFLDSIGPWGQMIAFGLATAFAGRMGLSLASMIPGMPDISNGFTGTLAVLGAVAAAPMLADAFHAATNNTGPAPSTVAANALGGIDFQDIASDGVELLDNTVGGTYRAFMGTPQMG